MGLNAELLNDSFALVVDREPELTARFYENLFERHPEARPLFHRNEPQQQQKMLQEALVAVLDHLDDAPWLTDTLGALGAKHVEYGVTEPMYAWVGGSLLVTLEEVAGDDWTEEMAEAWGDAYGAIRDLMLAGASQPEASDSETSGRSFWSRLWPFSRRKAR